MINYKGTVLVMMPNTRKYRQVGIFGEFESLQAVIDCGVELLGGIQGRPHKWLNKPKAKNSNRKGNMCRW